MSKRLSAYFHLPFCQRICVYCDFFVTTARNHFSRFTDCLEKEVHLLASQFAARPLNTVYFGGGTPSYLPIENFEKILSGLRSQFKFHEQVEITLELNPADVHLDQLIRYRQLGINRLSIGIQSFNDKELTFLTRTHTGQQAIDTYEDARQAGFDNVSIDLIYGLPDQTPGNWKKNIRKALDLGPEHISSYSLTIEAGAHLSKLVEKGVVNPLGDDKYLEMYLRLCDALETAGYEHYEISNFGKTGFRSRHNSAYWSGEEYIGLGPSAHSFLTDGAVKSRRWNHRNLVKYMQELEEGRLPISQTENLSLEQQAIEAVFLGLRTKEGLNVASFDSEFNLNAKPKLKEKTRDLSDYLVLEGDRIMLTKRGLFVCDEITSELITVF